jgi:hypothetical protein
MRPQPRDRGNACTVATGGVGAGLLSGVGVWGSSNENSSSDARRGDAGVCIFG